ncbi:zinc finger, CCHC-type containing protein [Tanacetum coccineum]
MGDENPIRTIGDYSKPSHEGYKNTIELPVGNNVVPLRSDTIRNWLERLPAGSITIWEDLTTRFLAQFFPPGRTAKLRNDIMMFQQHHEESLSEAWTRFKDLLQKFSHHGIDRWLQIQIFYDHVSFHLKCEIDSATDGKLRNKNVDESWEIIDNLALYDHEGWNDTKEFVKPFKSNPQPHTERMERFENAIFKQREEINDRMTEMVGLLKELMTSRTPKKVLIREEVKFPISKNVNSISLAREEEERSEKIDVATGNDIENLPEQKQGCKQTKPKRRMKLEKKE